jgi:nitroimidazol reductase NimA-like FMN-containing flavoprotein (pyridoxamine 5'-phosphate oxidase superfamily)
VDAPGIDLVARETGAMEVLTEEQCWSLLGSVELGRLAVVAAGDVDIYPLNFAVEDRTIMFRSAEGTKLVEVILAGRVAFEVDGYDPVKGRAWSVVAKGTAELLDKFDDIYAAQELPLFPWNHSPKERFVRIRPTTVTGRRFTVYATREALDQAPR